MHLSNKLECQQQAYDADYYADVKEVCAALAGPQDPTGPRQH